MAMGITDHAWSIGELVDAATATELAEAAKMMECPSSEYPN